ncbi:MAG: hydantoinase/carbamoylase family amidase [Solirubrobacterales bacterium]|nr:hydantoinase/carbamoylase family amidase [Solirubrobacterales bacterium]
MPDRRRIAARLDELWGIARGPRGGADRPAYSSAEAEATRRVAAWATELGLEPAIDPHGNLWALPGGWKGPVVTSGSHLDTVPDGGRYDGALGTALGLELVADLAAATANLPARPGLLVCAAEEAPRFGAGTIGSRLLVGSLHPAELADLRDAGGVSAAEALARYLRELADLPRCRPATDRLRAHAEVHVATRRALRELGVVTRVASPRRLVIELTGESGHAGEVAMDERRDALVAAAEIVLAVEAAAREEPDQTVATVGTAEVAPGAISVIPGQVTLGVDARAIDAASLDRLEAAIRARAADIAARRGIGVEVRLTRAGTPTALDGELARAALRAAGELGITAETTWSGSGHDAQHLIALAPTLLMFVPLHGGESHTPQEGADLDEIVAAARIVAAVMARV